MEVPIVPGGQKRVSGPLELGLWKMGNLCVGARN